MKAVVTFNKAEPVVQPPDTVTITVDVETAHRLLCLVGHVTGRGQDAHRPFGLYRPLMDALGRLPGGPMKYRLEHGAGHEGYAPLHRIHILKED